MEKEENHLNVHLLSVKKVQLYIMQNLDLFGVVVLILVYD